MNREEKVKIELELLRNHFDLSWEGKDIIIEHIEEQDRQIKKLRELLERAINGVENGVEDEELQ